MSETALAYDEVPYEEFSYPQSHPDRLASVGTLFGMAPRPATSCRVLELGCATGGNLLPMAASLPGSHFTGVDISPGQIASANHCRQALNLHNVEFHALSLEEVGDRFGQFDYIIAHGVYSWVAQPLREKLLALYESQLAPAGIGYISFNTYPGWSTRRTLRELVWEKTRGCGSLREQIARSRSLFSFLEAAFRGRTDPFAQLVHEEVGALRDLGDAYIAHEYLEPVNEPCYFHEFATQAAAHQLQYLGESEIQTMGASDLAPAARDALRSQAANLLEAEQYLDVLRNRAFRQTLVCRASVQLERRIAPEKMQLFSLASSARPVTAVGNISTDQSLEFRGADGIAVRANDPLTKAALCVLAESWPSAIPFAELLSRAGSRSGITAGANEAAALASRLLAAHAASRAVELWRTAPVFEKELSNRPVALEMARWQAGRGSRVTNGRHENLTLGPGERALLQRLDGTATRVALLSECENSETLLAQFAGAALLIG